MTSDRLYYSCTKHQDIWFHWRPSLPSRVGGSQLISRRHDPGPRDVMGFLRDWGELGHELGSGVDMSIIRATHRTANAAHSPNDWNLSERRTSALVALRVIAATVSRISSLPALSFSGDLGLLGIKTLVPKFTISLPPFLPLTARFLPMATICRLEAKALFQGSVC